jgi:hypothetical protein
VKGIVMDELNNLMEQVILALFKYYYTKILDDETEFFPLLTTVIYSFPTENGIGKNNILTKSILFSKNEYVKCWLEYANQDGIEYFDLNLEKDTAEKTFLRYFKNTKIEE